MDKLVDNVWVRGVSRLSIAIGAPFFLWFAMASYEKIGQTHQLATRLDIIITESVIPRVENLEDDYEILRREFLEKTPLLKQELEEELRREVDRLQGEIGSLRKTFQDNSRGE